MDVITIDKTDEHFRMLYDAKGRFVVHRLNAKNNDVIKLDLATGKAVDLIKFEVGQTAIITKGQNQGRIGTITGREKHVGSFEIVHIKDSKGRSFSTRLLNVFPISAKDDEPVVSLPKGKGLRDNILEERKKRLGY